MDTKEKQLRNKIVRQVKIQWKHRKGSNATRETEEEMRRLYPHLFNIELYFVYSNFVNTAYIYEFLGKRANLWFEAFSLKNSKRASSGKSRKRLLIRQTKDESHGKLQKGSSNTREITLQFLSMFTNSPAAVPKVVFHLLSQPLEMSLVEFVVVSGLYFDPKTVIPLYTVGITELNDATIRISWHQMDVMMSAEKKTKNHELVDEMAEASSDDDFVSEHLVDTLTLTVDKVQGSEKSRYKSTSSRRFEHITPLDVVDKKVKEWREQYGGYFGATSLVDNIKCSKDEDDFNFRLNFVMLFEASSLAAAFLLLV
ncbi:hypothetical protein E3N88_34540 [Mikania micrantha]|uniref:Uncharacterized protein n=1 Tax=Mikania micrantha TaxID=192012 RepID=A0A5N6LYF1_9ASTR|nr:hypothetical protein E3N88_34540 [Mikania micrantha]